MDKRALRNILMNRGKDYGMKFDIKSSFIKNNKKYVKYNNGPTIYFDGHKNTNVFELFEKNNVTELTSETLIPYLIYNGQPSHPGIYLLDNGGKRIVIQTKNIAKSMAKVIIDATHVKNIKDKTILSSNNRNDVFALRLATAPVMKFEILSLSADNEKAAFLAGLNDTMNPSVTLGSFINYQGFKEYRKGLEIGGHFTSLLIENMLDEKTYPEFVRDFELEQWRPNETNFENYEKVSADFYNSERNKLMSK